MESGELSRAIGHPWSVLWPKVRKQEERKDVGKALSPEEEHRLLDSLASDNSPNRSQTLSTVVRIALLTGVRIGEIIKPHVGTHGLRRSHPYSGESQDGGRHRQDHSHEPTIVKCALDARRLVYQ